MRFLEGMKKNEFMVVVTDESKYYDVLDTMLKDVKKSRGKICYVCLNRTYKDVCELIKKNKISTENFIFVDTLSSYYQLQKPTKKCVFVSAPSALGEIQKAVLNLVEKKDCKLVIFDTISTLLIYKQPENVVRFTNDLMITVKDKAKGIIYIYVIIKTDQILRSEHQELIEDLAMFAEKVVNLSKDENKVFYRSRV